MINMIPFLVLFLLAVLGKSEGRGLGTVFSKIEMNYLRTGAHNSPPLQGGVRGQNFLQILAIGPIECLIVSDDGVFPPKYHEFTKIKSNELIELFLTQKFRVYASSVENVRFRVNNGPEKLVSGTGSGKFSFPERSRMPKSMNHQIMLNNYPNY